VREEAHATAATGAVLARLRAVARGVQPALEDAVRELARVTFLAAPLAELRTRRAGVVELARVAAARLLAGMRVRTLGPVVRPATCASTYLELVHAEVVAGVGVHRRVGLSLRVGVRVCFVRRKVAL